MRGEGFLARCLRGRCCTRGTDFLAVVWSLVLHASRRHCLEALYKTQDKLEMRQMDITKDMRTTKHLLEENWQEELALIEQSRNASLPEHENEQKMSHCRVWRTRWHRARDVGAISAKGSQSGDRKNWEVNVGARADDPTGSPERGGVGLGGQSIATRRTSQRASAHRCLPLGVASIRPFLSNLLQWVPRRHESSFHSSKGEPTAVYGVQCQPASATAVHQVPGT